MNIFKRWKTGDHVEIRQEPPLVQSRSVGIGENYIELICPYCGKKHFHGVGGDESFLRGEPSHRLSHCLNKGEGNVGYSIILSEANRLELLGKISELRKNRKRQTQCDAQMARPRCTGTKCSKCDILAHLENLLIRPKKESVENAR